MPAPAEKRITAARTALVLDQPFFGSLILSLKMKADPTCDTAWTDGRSIGYNPAYVDGLNDAELLGLLAHEVMHPALGHNWRRDGRAMPPWNIACDKTINNELRDAGFTLPPDGYYAEGEEIGKSAEWIFGNTREQEQPEPEPQPEPGNEPDEPQDGEDEPGKDGKGKSDGEDGESDEDGNGETEGDGEGDSEGDSETEGEGNGKGNGKGKPNPHGECRDAPTEADEDGEAPTEQDWKEKAATAAIQAAAQGKLPAGLKRLVEQAMKPKIDVRALLLRFFSERTNGDYSWTRPNVRYIPQGLYLPALYTETLGHVAIVNDTSGSRGNKAMDQARQIVESVIEEVNPETVTVYHADAEVAKIDRIERGEPIVWETAGGGGTDFRPALEAIEAEGTAVCAVYITDLWGTFPDTPPPFPVIWLSTTENLEAPFGETVFVEGV